MAPSDYSPSSLPLSRRSLLSSLACAGAVTVLAPLTPPAAQAAQRAINDSPLRPPRRIAGIRKVRERALALSLREVPRPAAANGEERDYPYLATFGKGLPHNALGEPDPRVCRQLIRILNSRELDKLEALPLGGVRPLRNPASGLAYDLEGRDSHLCRMPAAPRMDSPRHSAEMVELYWQAILRDVPFTTYSTDPLAAAAAAELSRLSDFRGPRAAGQVTPDLLFRGPFPGEEAGPWISQFLLRNIPYGTLTISQRQRTAEPGIDFMTDPAEWLGIQAGELPTTSDAWSSTPRYMRNGRDLCSYVHLDALYEAYLNACLILLALGAPLNPGNPYNRLTRTDGFGTFGPPHILSLVTEVATRALKAVWYQKWFIHRRMRPEEFGGRVHHHLTGAAVYPIDAEVLNSTGVTETASRFGSYLLPQAFPEGSPMHPAYGSGHATVAGACITILKAWFDERWVLPEVVVPAVDGDTLVPWGGTTPLTVGGELHKLASNIAMGRNFAGVHWRTDAEEGIRLGEEVACSILREQRLTYHERSRLTFTKLDGTPIRI